MLKLNGARDLVPRTHLPLRQLALCLDCDECFEIGYPACPGCGSESWTALARFIEMGGRSTIRVSIAESPTSRPDQKLAVFPQLLIVARPRIELYAYLKRTFGKDDGVNVILDRRNLDRRQRMSTQDSERRRADRRDQRTVEQQLRALGWTITGRTIRHAPAP